MSPTVGDIGRSAGLPKVSGIEEIKGVGALSAGISARLRGGTDVIRPP